MWDRFGGSGGMMDFIEGNKLKNLIKGIGATDID